MKFRPVEGYLKRLGTGPAIAAIPGTQWQLVQTHYAIVNSHQRCFATDCRADRFMRWP
jgi:hypothetical protein